MADTSTSSPKPLQSPNPRQRASILQGSQFPSANSLGNSMHMQALMLGFGSQLRANGSVSYGQHRINPTQLRQLSQQTSLSSPQ
ncbi:Transcription initiation factor TFIID subunit 12b, partial [Bienertia sinuspersici]